MKLIKFCALCMCSLIGGRASATTCEQFLMPLFPFEGQVDAPLNLVIGPVFEEIRLFTASDNTEIPVTETQICNADFYSPDEPLDSNTEYRIQVYEDTFVSFTTGQHVDHDGPQFEGESRAHTFSFAAQLPAMLLTSLGGAAPCGADVRVEFDNVRDNMTDPSLIRFSYLNEHGACFGFYFSERKDGKTVVLLESSAVELNPVGFIGEDYQLSLVAIDHAGNAATTEPINVIDTACGCSANTDGTSSFSLLSILVLVFGTARARGKT